MPDRLHLDLSAGARGDMIAGALLAVGAPLAAARDALRSLGLASIELDVERVRRGGLLASCLSLSVDGEALRPGLFVEESGRSVRPERRERHRHAVPQPRRHEASRAPLVPVSTAAAVEGGGPVFGRDDDDDDVPRIGSRAGPKARSRRGAPVLSPWERWLAGEAARGADLVDVLKRSSLSPVVKALAVRSARRLTDALQAVAGADAHVEGRTAVRITCELVVVAALVDALSPAAVTASPVAVSRGPRDVDGVVGAAAWPSPSPWLLEVLAGIPVLERDDAIPLSDVAGAAAAWACVARFGARGVSSSTLQGLGASGVDPPGRFVGARALLGPPAAVATRVGTRQVEPALSLAAFVPGEVDGPELARTLFAAGATELIATPAEPLGGPSRGSAGLMLRAVVPVATADAATSALWRAGAVDVSATWIELRSAAVRDVTVPVGKSRKNQKTQKTQKKLSVTVRVVTDGDEVVRVEPDLEQCRAAARVLRTSLHSVAAEAVAAWEGRGDPGAARQPEAERRR